MGPTGLYAKHVHRQWSLSDAVSSVFVVARHRFNFFIKYTLSVFIRSSHIWLVCAKRYHVGEH